ncbi:MAG: hypothetical protein IT366_16435 [Candidatus Hydrogenedentes bacterium]|nr:hypothetical protein [Candidatus Hydrogenedentota bacterium]
MMLSAALCIVVALLGAGDANDCVAMSGNGSLTIGFDSSGALSICRWPGTTAANQVTYSSVDAANRGGMWGVPREGGVDWLPEKYACNAVVTIAESGMPIVTIAHESIGATETAFVCNDIDVAVFRLEFKEMPASNTAIWYSDFSPCTSVVRALPSSEWIFSARRDMVAFTQDDTVYHARPNAPSSALWDDVKAWLAGGAAPYWFTKGNGTWIAYAADTKFAGAACGAEHGENSAEAFAEASEWNAHARALGACASAAAIPVDPGTRSATVYVALGETRADADGALSIARHRGFQALLDAARADWKERVQIGALPTDAGDGVAQLKARAEATLLTLADRNIGAVARGPQSRPATCVAVARNVSTIAYALDLAGHSEAATRLLKFYAHAVRTSDAPGAPAGSLPAQLYANGEEASPQVILDVQAPAWLLWSIWQHDARLPEQQREAYRKDLRKSVELAGDFLSNWSRAIRDTPAFSYDYIQKRDTHSVNTIAVVYAGLRAANAFMRASGEERTDWAQRSVELEDYLRFNALDSSGKFKAADPLSLWMTEIVGAGDPRWNATVQSVGGEISANPNPESLEKLVKLSMLLRDQNEKLSALKPVAVTTAQAALKIYPCDSYYAALALIAILTVYK